MYVTLSPVPKSSFKPHLMHQDFLSKSPHILLKRNYKLVHGLGRQHSHSIPKLKYLASLGHHPNYSPKNLSHWKKSIKPYRKYLRNIKGKSQDPSIQKLLPLLSDLKLSSEPQNWRLLSSRSALRRLMFDFIAPFLSRDRYDLQDLLHKHKAALTRNLPRMKDLNKLIIKVSEQTMEAIIFMLKMLSDKICPDSLEHFHLFLVRCHNSQAVINFNGAFRFVTSLDVQDGMMFSQYLSSTVEFKNLTNLRILYIFPEKSWDFSHLACFKDLSSLRKLELSFTVNSFDKEKEFFENFSLPPTLEHLDLSLECFAWSENKWDDEAIQNGFDTNPLYTQFYEKMQNCQGLKTLHLKCQDDMGVFSRRFIQQFTQLEKLVFHSEQTHSQSSIEPLIFQDYWGAVARSKETLTDVWISYVHITFPEKIDGLETEFPRLKKLYLNAHITPSNQLGEFCKKIPSLDNIWLSAVSFDDVKELGYFLSSWRLVPSKMKFGTNLQVSAIKQKPLIECLTKYISEAKIRGELEVNFKIGDYFRQKALQGLVELSEKKGSLDVVLEKDVIKLCHRSKSS